jgi:hypothetical protein
MEQDIAALQLQAKVSALTAQVETLTARIGCDMLVCPYEEEATRLRAEDETLKGAQARMEPPCRD